MREAIEKIELSIHRLQSRGCLVFASMIEWIRIYSEMTRGTEQSLNLKLNAKLSKIADNALLPRLLWDGARTYLLRMDVTHEDLQRMGPFINWGPFVAIRPHMQVCGIPAVAPCRLLFIGR